MPDQFDIGSFANAGQDFLVVDAVSRIEILRGPASTLFGNDALGGVVAIVTRDPEEFLRHKDSHLGGSVAFNGRDDSTVLSASAALGGDTRFGRINGVVHLSQKEGHEIDSSATDSRDPLDRSQTSVMAKLHNILPSGNRLTLDLSSFTEETTSQVTSVLGYGRKFRSTTALYGEDTRDRHAVTAGYEFQSELSWLDQGRVSAYWQQVEVDQQTEELRDQLNPPVSNQRGFTYDTQAYGAIVDLASTFSGKFAEHRIGWGLSVQRASITEQRNGSTTNLLNGETNNVLIGEVFPVRDFPETKVDEIALYIHDEITMGAFTLIPGLRYQTYQLDAKNDSIYAADNPGNPAVDTSESSLAPKLGLKWIINPNTTGYIQYAHGFRAPPFEDVNIGFDIPLFNYRALPNPALKAETSEGFEIGLRFEQPIYRLSVSLFGADYDNLIETRANLGREPVTDTLLFQSRNIDEARVYGAEVDFNLNLDHWVTGLTFDASANYTHGQNQTTDQPLNTIDPAELVTAFTWQPRQSMRYALITTVVAPQTRTDDPAGTLIQTDGFTLVDMTASYQMSNGMSFDLGIFNLFDQTYWRWSSVRNRPQDDPMIDYLSAPGRYASVSMRMVL